MDLFLAFIVIVVGGFFALIAVIIVWDAISGHIEQGKIDRSREVGQIARIYSKNNRFRFIVRCYNGSAEAYSDKRYEVGDKVEFSRYDNEVIGIFDARHRRLCNHCGNPLQYEKCDICGAPN
jgi:hypothetical protein